jgi:hypothetical protein
MKIVKYVLVFICFGLGVAFCIGTISLLRDPYGSDPAWLTGMIGAMFLLGAFLLFRRTGVIRDKNRGSLGLTSNVETSTADRFRSAVSGFIKIICEDNNPSEIKSSGYAVASAVGFIVGFAAVRAGEPFEKFLEWCREGFEKGAHRAYRDHTS